MSRAVRRLAVTPVWVRATRTTGDSFTVSDSARPAHAAGGTESFTISDAITSMGHGVQTADSFIIADAASHS